MAAATAASRAAARSDAASEPSGANAPPGAPRMPPAPKGAGSEAHRQHGRASHQRLPAASHQHAPSEPLAQHSCEPVAERHAEEAERAHVRRADTEREQRERRQRHRVVHRARRVLAAVASHERQLLPTVRERVHKDERSGKRRRPQRRIEEPGRDEPPAAQRDMHELAGCLRRRATPRGQAGRSQHRQYVRERDAQADQVLHHVAHHRFPSSSAASASSTNSRAVAFDTTARCSKQR